ncbi:MAG: FG-GAP repeat protein [Ignavibacteria bacterium]|nr:FG-GAP repeat protein [Ignavibacteria bacterium]
MTGETLGAAFGNSVSSAGDVSRDGYSDVIVGSVGRAFIYFGGASMNNIADVTMTGELQVTLLGIGSHRPEMWMVTEILM